MTGNDAGDTQSSRTLAVVWLVPSVWDNQHRSAQPHRQRCRTDPTVVDNSSRPWEQYTERSVLNGDHFSGASGQSVQGASAEDEHRPAIQQLGTGEVSLIKVSRVHRNGGTKREDNRRRPILQESG